MSPLDTNAVCLRAETNADRGFLLNLYISTRDKELLDTGWTQKQIRSFLLQQFEAQFGSYHSQYPLANFDIIEYQGKRIGRLYLDKGKHDYRLIDISLLPEYQNRGIGHYLLQSLLQQASDDALPVSLHVERNNPARALYERLGFRVQKNLGVYLLMRWISEKDNPD